MTIPKIGFTSPWNHIDSDHSTPFETASEFGIFVEDVFLHFLPQVDISTGALKRMVRNVCLIDHTPEVENPGEPEWLDSHN